MKLTAIVFMAIASLSAGCATDLKAVRGFAEETKRISVAFDPFLDGAVTQCHEQVKFKALYTSETPVKDFDPLAIAKSAEATCKPIAEKNEVAREISSVLASYASQLSAIAGDGVGSSIDDSYEKLSAKIGEFDGVPTEKVTAVTALIKFVTRSVIAHQQRQEIEAALNHEEVVGLLADALVMYSDRVFGGFVSDRTRTITSTKALITSRAIDMPPMLAKLQLVQLASEEAQLEKQRSSVVSLRTSVAQMKGTMKDLRSNLNNLSAPERLNEVRKLAKEVRILYQQLAQAF